VPAGISEGPAGTTYCFAISRRLRADQARAVGSAVQRTVIRRMVRGDQSPRKSLGRLRPGTSVGARICWSPGYGFDQLVEVYQS
jgi:hypothetical protein